MKFLLSIILTSLLSFIAGIYFPWWTIAIVAFLVAMLIPQTITRSFFAGFLAIFLLWAILALWIDIKNDSILSNRVAQLFSLGYSFIIIVVTAFTGALISGLAAISGSALVTKKRNHH